MIFRPGVVTSDGRFVTGKPRAGPTVLRRGTVAGLPRGDPGDRRSQPTALLRALSRVRLGSRENRRTAGGGVAVACRPGVVSAAGPQLRPQFAGRDRWL